MDTDSLSFCYEEHFSHFDSSMFLNEESQSMDAIGDNDWQWEVETELNGDIALIPMSSGLDMNYSSNSPPLRGDFQNIMSEFHIEVPEMETLTPAIPLSAYEENEPLTPNSSPLPTLDISPSSFNLLEYANDMDIKPNIGNRSVSSGKKIDMNAQCYILEKDQTVIAPKLELSDSSDDEFDFITPKSEEIDIIDEEIPDDILPKYEYEEDQIDADATVDFDRNSNESENDYIDVDTISEQGTPILQAGDLNSLLEQFEATETSQYLKPTPQLCPNQEIFEPKSPKLNKETFEPKSPKQNTSVKPELIQRIKASSKRRVIPVIDPPIPNKRRGNKKPQTEVQSIPQIPQVKEEKLSSESVQLDHDYCTQATPYPKHPSKDSGFESAEEDEQRNILRNQPTVKGANGKLMVSLLKVNTIRNNSVNNSSQQKRKLNLEEYKKRREGFVRSGDNSQNNSPAHSGRSSPTGTEDEQARLIKHQQKLMQMAAEVLNTPPKSASKSSPLIAPIETLPQIVVAVAQGFVAAPPARIPPDNIEVKVLVSIGVNTDLTNQDLLLTSKRLNQSATELDEIRPILETASTKIDNNSLITSVIENIRQKKVKQNVTASAQSNVKKQSKEQQHGEDKIIAYLDKHRPLVETKSVEVQTEETFIEKTKRKRRRSSSSSSSDHRKSYKRRSGSNDSRYSYSSQSSSSYSSRSRSRSPSPRRAFNKKRPSDSDHLREVEERRIIFVGGLSSTMTKEVLRRRFIQFGPIVNVSVHFRDIGDNYGFVTFVYKEDAYAAVEHGNEDPSLPQYDISFGGRRIFCGTVYSDLDNVHDEMSFSSPRADNSFDNLLREAQAKLRKRKSST